jgi:hypothetical protein
MFVKITDKSIYSTVFILILVLITLIIGYVFINKKQKKYEFLGNLFPEQTLEEEIKTEIKGEIKEEYCNDNYICNQKCDKIYLPPNFKFDTPENIRDHIEDFFNIYLDIVDIGCINDKIKRYINPNLTIGKIFKEKNLLLTDLNPNIFASLDNIYYANNPLINDLRLNKYAIFKMIKQRLENFKLNNNNYNFYYDNSFNMFMINKNIKEEDIREKIKPKDEEILEKVFQNGVEIEQRRKIIDRNEIEHTGDCTGQVCKMSINTLTGQDMIRKLNAKANKGWDKVQILRQELSSNIEFLKLVLEVQIVTDLLFKYYDITNITDMTDINNINNIRTLLTRKGIFGNYTSLQTLLNSSKNSIKLRDDIDQDFKNKFTSILGDD